MRERLHPAGARRGGWCACGGAGGVDAERDIAVQRLRGHDTFHVLRGGEDEVVDLTLAHARAAVLEVHYAYGVVDVDPLLRRIDGRGDLGLKDADVDAIVAFLESLDGQGYQDIPPKTFPQ